MRVCRADRPNDEQERSSDRAEEDQDTTAKRIPLTGQSEVHSHSPENVSKANPTPSTSTTSTGIRGDCQRDQPNSEHQRRYSRDHRTTTCRSIFMSIAILQVQDEARLSVQADLRSLDPGLLSRDRQDDMMLSGRSNSGNRRRQQGVQHFYKVSISTQMSEQHARK